MREKVRSVIDEWSARPFSYGNDCCQFAGAMVEAITGKNPMAGFSYSNEREAYLIINKFGGLYPAMVATLGEPGGTPKDGDVTIHDMKNGLQIAGSVYQGRSVVKTEHGLVDWPLSWAKAIWSI